MINFVNRISGCAHRLSFGLVPRSLISFVIVGALGMIVHLTIMKTCMSALHLDFRRSNFVAMVVAASFNYSLNNIATFKDRMLRGRSILVGYILYMGVTSLGLAVNMGISTGLYRHGCSPVMAAIGGIACGSVWNYLMSYTFVWRLITAVLAKKSG